MDEFDLNYHHEIDVENIMMTGKSKLQKSTNDEIEFMCI